MATEIEKLLLELRSMKSDQRAKHIANTKEVWSNIGSKDLQAAGFETQAELEAWLENNDYAAL
ncbi:MAG: hypothetical protein AABY22_19570 [Nanoarchaeota archaeon]